LPDLGVAIIGLRHLHSLGYVDTIRQVEGLRLVGVVENDEALLRSTCDALGLPGHSDLGEALARPDADIALILLPHRDCPDAAIQAAKAGKHVIVEKPCAASAESWRAALREIRAAGVQCAVPFVWRRHPLVTEMMRVIAAGDIGRPLYLSGNIIGGPPSRYTSGPSPWMVDKALSGGGALHNLGVHYIDLFNWLLGQRPCRVSAQVSSAMHGLQIEDYGRVLMEYPGGECASVEAGYSLPRAYPPAGYDFSVCAKGQLGCVQWSTADDHVVVASDAPALRHAPVRRQRVAYPTPPGYIGLPSILFLEETVAALRKGQSVPITGEDALAALEVVEAAYRAAGGGVTLAQWEEVG
jgi:predicted dehydrogenase